MRGSIPNMSEDERQALREFPRSGSGVFAGMAPEELGVEFSPDGLVVNDDAVIERLVAEGVSESEAPGRVAEFEAWGQYAAAKARLLAVDMPAELREQLEALVWLLERRGTAAFGIAVHRHNEARAAYDKARGSYEEADRGLEDYRALVALLMVEKGITIEGADGKARGWPVEIEEDGKVVVVHPDGSVTPA
jgi:hypothetical protein